jgi:hypothetical protein
VATALDHLRMHSLLADLMSGRRSAVCRALGPRGAMTLARPVSGAISPRSAPRSSAGPPAAPGIGRIGGRHAGTNDPAKASQGPDGSPQSNEAPNIWVTETALTTALNTSFFAEAVALFAIIMGVAMLLIGVGFLVLTVVARRAAGADTAVPAPPAPATAPAA